MKSLEPLSEDKRAATLRERIKKKDKEKGMTLFTSARNDLSSVLAVQRKTIFSSTIMTVERERKIEKNEKSVQ